MEKLNNKEENTVHIKDLNVIRELFEGKTLDIIIELMDNELTEEQLISRLEIYPIKLKYYLNKLQKLGIVKCVKEDVVRQEIKSTYVLEKDNFECYIDDNNSDINLNLIFDINKYINFMKKGFKILSKNSHLPNKQGAIFIHANEEKVREFKKEINLLIEKFIQIEDNQEKQGYLLLPMLFPHEVEENENV